MLITKLAATLEDGTELDVTSPTGSLFSALSTVLQGVVARRHPEHVTASHLHAGHPDRFDAGRREE